MVSGYQHWKNLGQGGDTVFVTTTALDFVHVLAATDAKERMAHLLLSDHELYGAALHAFVVMQNHVHFVSRVPQGHDVGWFVQRIKANSARMLKPLLAADQITDLGPQTGLNGRSFWQRSFRSVVVVGEAMFWQKVNYIHQNPVRAGLVERPEDYRWSSARMIMEGKWEPQGGLRVSDWNSVHSGAVEA